MGTSGVPWEKDRNVIIMAIKKHKGKINHIALDPMINCHYQTVKKRIDNDEELKELMANYRNHWVSDIVDQAEDVLKKVMDKVDDKPEAALKSAMFALNNLGRDRGYSAPEEKAANANPQVIVLDYSKSNCAAIQVPAETLPASCSEST